MTDLGVLYSHFVFFRRLKCPNSCFLPSRGKTNYDNIIVEWHDPKSFILFHENNQRLPVHRVRAYVRIKVHTRHTAVGSTLLSRRF